MLSRAVTTLFFLLCFCSAAFSQSRELVIPGTGDSQLLLRALARQYMASRPDVIVHIPDSIGSGGGIKAVINSTNELARVARAPKGRELIYNLQYEVFAHSPIVFAVNPSVKGITGLTYRQIVDIYSGRISTWDALGGSGKIYVANREIGDSSRSVLAQKIPGFQEIRQFAGEIIYKTPDALLTVQTYANTIGYLPLAAIKETDLKILAVNGAMPSPEAVRANEYELAVPLGLVWKKKLSPLAADFVGFLASEEASSIMMEHGAFPVQ